MAGLTPTLTVELGLTAAPLDPISGISWTAISTYVIELSCSRGRQHVRAQTEASTAQLTLKNIDGRFSPHNTTGAYYPNLNPMVRIRIRATYNAVTYDIFHGYVTSWKPSWPDLRNGICEIECVDAFKLLSLKNPLNAGYSTYITGLSPRVYYRFGENPGATTVSDSSGNSRDGYTNQADTGTVVFAQAGSLVADTDGAADFGGESSVTRDAFGNRSDSHQNGVVSLPVAAAPTGSGAMTFAFSLYLRDTGITQSIIYSHWETTGGLQIGPGGASTGDAYSITWNAVSTGGTSQLFQSAASISYDTSHRIVIVRASDGLTVSVYVDGTLLSSGSAGVSVNIPAPTTRATIGGGIITDTLKPQLNGILDEFVILSSAWSASDVTTDYQKATSPLVSQASGTRIGVILDAIGWPSADRSLETGNSTLQAVGDSYVTDSALASIQTVTDTEAGLFFIDPAGVATFYQRQHLLTTATSTTSQATFGDSGSELGYRFGSDSLVFDDEDIWNEIRTQRVGGIEQIASSVTSQTSYGKRTLTKTELLTVSDSEVLDNANWLLAHYKDPIHRLPDLLTTPERAPTTLYPQALGRKLWDRVTGKRRPANSSTFSQDVMIEGITHHVIPGSNIWETRFQLSAAETQAYWILGTSALDTDTRLGF